MVKKSKSGPKLQGYPREDDTLLASPSLFPKPRPSLNKVQIEEAVDAAFIRSKMNKRGDEKPSLDSPEKMAELCLKHLRERSDPVLSPYFVSRLKADDLFELDAVSHEMQRHRMAMGVFYQYLILQLMRSRGWEVFDGAREGDIVADVPTSGFKPGLRLYMSIKKSADTVGGQDIEGVINRLERNAKEEKNLTRPYLCVVCVATPSRGKLRSFEEDRKIKMRTNGSPYSLNCEYWGAGFVFPYVTGLDASEIYLAAYRRVAQHLPFKSIEYRSTCSALLKEKLHQRGLLDENERVDPEKFMRFISGVHHAKKTA